MKVRLLKKCIAIILSIVLCVCSFAGTVTVAAQTASIPAVVNGKTYFIAAAAVNGMQPSVTVDLGDGTKTYPTMSVTDAITNALAKTAADNPVVGIYGATGATVNDISGTTPITITGLTTDASINMGDFGNLMFPATFTNITFNNQGGQQRQNWNGNDFVIGEGVKTSGTKFWFYPTNALPTDDTQTMVFDSRNFKASYFCIVGGESATVGSESAPKYLDITINDITLTNATNGGDGYANTGTICLGGRGGKSDFYGNIALRINGGHYPVKAITAKGGSTFTGTVTVIANSALGMSIDTSAIGQVDYFVVNDNAHGTVDVKDIKASVPTLLITAQSGFIPCVNGVKLNAVSGVYEYPLSASDTMQTINITYVDPSAPKVYEIDGENVAFTATDGKVEYNGETYNAYETFELAYKAIISQGGTIVVEGTHNLYTEKTAAKAVKILGLGRNVSKLVLPGSYNSLYGEIEIDEIALSTTDGSGDANIAVDRFTIGPKTKSYGTFWFTGFVTSQPGETCYLVHNGSDTGFMLSVSQKSWQIPANTNIHEIHNGGYVNFDIQCNGVVNGNMTYIFNDVTFFNNKKVTVSKDPSGALTLVFNNGITDMTVKDDNGYVDYILNVAKGGYADIKTEAGATTAPTFRILPPIDKAPCINGVKLKSVNGEYLYTPASVGTTDITFVESEEPRLYTIGDDVFAFVAKDGAVTYHNEQYYAYSTYELAYKALATGGGVLAVEDKQALYSEKTTTTPIRVIGVGADAAVTYSAYQTLYGDTEFDNIRFQSVNNNTDTLEFKTVGNVTFGKTVTFGAMNSIGFVGLSSEITDLVNNGDTVTLKWQADGVGPAGEVFYIRALNGTVGRANKKVNVQLIMDGTGYTSTFGNALGLGGNLNGSFTFIINDSSRFYKKSGINKTITLGGTVSDALTVIFNNGIDDVVIDETADAADYVLNVAHGGYAYVKTEGTATTAPTFVIQPPVGKKPVVNSVQIEKTDGEYRYTPTATGVLDITFDYANTYIPSITVAPKQQITITKLQTDSRNDPTGIDETAPVLSWIIESTRRGAKQTAYRVGVSSSSENLIAGIFDVWDSGKVTSSDTSITYGAVGGLAATSAKALQARTRYYWTVYAWNENSVENRSTQIGTFETALFGDFGSNNYWISAQKPTSATVADTAGRLFRKQFTLSQAKEKVVKARLYSTAAGNQIMYVNGERASDDYFAPGKSKYTKMFYYQTYDVTELLQEGDNTIGAEVGQGWYNAGAVAANYGSNVALKAKLVVTYQDGTEQVINTDSSWKGTMQGATLSNSFYDGQAVDGREYINGWAENNNASSKWQSVTASSTHTTAHGSAGSIFVAENMEPVRNVLTLTPSTYEQKSATSRLYTFDQNFAGTVRITAKAKAGVTMTLKYSEFLTNGTITGSEYNGHNGIDKYTFRGDANGETVTFDLVYHGFQYLLVSNESTGGTLATEPIEILSVEGLVLSSDQEETATFDSSNDTIDQYVQNVLWSLRSNFISTITDCPTREKNTWTGDAQIISGTAAYYADVYNLYRNFQLMTQHSAFGDGGLPEIVPEATKNNASTSETRFVAMPAGWTDSAVIITWQMYNQYGNVNIINDNYATMKNFVDCLVRQRTYQSGDEIPYFVIDPTDLRVDGGQYGDWLSKSNGNANASYYEKTYYATSYSGPRPISFVEIGTAYLAHSCDLLSQMAKAVGKTSEATYYHNLYQRFAKAWRKNFVAADGYTCTSNGISVQNADGTYTYTPGEGWATSYALGLEFNLFENEEKAQKAAAKLASLMEKWGYQQMIGFLGADTLYTGLSHNGQFDAALKIMENEKNPSLLYSVKQGATTIWETYDGTNYSRNHYVFGAPSRWLFSDVLGITHGYEADNVGYTHFVLQPHYSSDTDTTLTRVKGSYTARTGTIKSEWQLSADRDTFTYRCTVPANTTATLSLPLFGAKSAVTENGVPAADSQGVTFVEIQDGRAYYEITSGTYEFVVTDAVAEINVQPPQKRVYRKGETSPDVFGGMVNVIYSSGKTETFPLTADMIRNFDASTVGKQAVTVTYGGVSDTYDIEVLNTDAVPTITVDNVTANAGDTVSVAVRLKNNPGITSADLFISYDNTRLQLLSYAEKDFANLSCGSVNDQPIAVRWQGATNNGETFLTLTFRVNDAAPLGAIPITIEGNYANVLFNVANGAVTVTDRAVGDLNGDGAINNKDLGLLQRYINLWNVKIDHFAADLNGDGKINNKDLGVLQRYINGWDIELK